MSDIVENLRQGKAGYQSYSAFVQVTPTHLEAANEIERLQVENARLREAIKAAFAEGFSAGREEGLEDGLVRPEGVYSRCDSKTEQSYWQDSHARAALGEKE